MGLKARFIEENGTKAWLRIYWGEDCPNCMGGDSTGIHNAQVLLEETDVIENWELGGSVKDYPEYRWPTNCDHCGTKAPAELHQQVFRKRRYNTKSGNPEPGDLYWATWYTTQVGTGCVFHDNCNGHHLFAVLPNGDLWDIDGRASNCTMKEDRVHRCWVRQGDPPNIDVSKRGNTCKAGGGSIVSGNYHGFLRNGTFT